MSQFDQLLFLVGFPKHTLVVWDILLMPDMEVIADAGETETDIIIRTDIIPLISIVLLADFTSSRINY